MQQRFLIKADFKNYLQNSVHQSINTCSLLHKLQVKADFLNYFYSYVHQSILRLVCNKKYKLSTSLGLTTQRIESRHNLQFLIEITNASIKISKDLAYPMRLTLNVMRCIGKIITSLFQLVYYRIFISWQKCQNKHGNTDLIDLDLLIKSYNEKVTFFTALFQVY